MSRPVSVEIAEAVAAARGVDPSDLGYSLGEYINTDAIEALAAHETANWTLTFELPEHTVTVTSGGAILVDREQRGPGPEDLHRPGLTAQPRPSQAERAVRRARRRRM